MIKRLSLLALVVLAVAASVFLLRFYEQNTTPKDPVLLRTPNSAYKYQLCSQAYAFAFASASNPFKTNYSFTDPFRKLQDTIVPHLLDYNSATETAHFRIDVLMGQMPPFHLDIRQVHELDGISVLLPDKQNQLQRSTEPQFIISALEDGKLAVLDYTCPAYWVWQYSH